MLVGECHGVADKELFGALSRLRRFQLNWRCGGIEENRRILNCPLASRNVVLYDCLCMSQLGDSAIRRRAQRIITDVFDGHANVQSLSNFEDPSGVIEHLSDGQVEAVQLGAGCLPKGVQDVHMSISLAGKRYQFRDAIDAMRRMVPQCLATRATLTSVACALVRPLVRGCVAHRITPIAVNVPLSHHAIGQS